jgi:hypothetical protein
MYDNIQCVTRDVAFETEAGMKCTVRIRGIFSDSWFLVAVNNLQLEVNLHNEYASLLVYYTVLTGKQFHVSKDLISFRVSWPPGLCNRHYKRAKCR